MTDAPSLQQPSEPQPDTRTAGFRFAPMPRNSREIGLGKTQLYDLAARGEIVLRKVGKRTFVDLGSLERFFDRQPAYTGQK